MCIPITFLAQRHIAIQTLDGICRVSPWNCSADTRQMMPLGTSAAASDQGVTKRGQKRWCRVRNYVILMARPTGFEPVTPAFGGQYSIQLSYGRSAGGRW